MTRESHIKCDASISIYNKNICETEKHEVQCHCQLNAQFHTKTLWRNWKIVNKIEKEILEYVTILGKSVQSSSFIQ